MWALNLTTRLVLLLTGCITITLLVITSIDYQISRGRLLAEVEQQAETTVAEAVRDLEVRLASLEESTELLAEVIEQRDHTEDQLRDLLREAVDEREDLFGAALALDPRFAENPARGFAPYYYYNDGVMQFADLAKAYDYVQSIWFREPLSRTSPTWSEPYFDDGGGNAFMATYSVPIFRTIDGERQVFGIVTADITLDELQYYLDRIDLGENGFGFLVSTSGRMMAGPNPDNRSKELLQVLPPGQDEALWARLLLKVAGGSPASAVMPCANSSSQCIVKLAPLQTTRWPVGVYYLEDEMLAPLREYLLRTAATTGITLLLLIIPVIWVSSRITRPLRALAVATVDIATGNFHTTLPAARSNDELGRLVHAFSVMQGNLQRFVDQLEQETASRNRLEGELNAASEIQMSMLPAGGKAYYEEEDYHLWAALRPAKSVGGDLYAVHAEREGRLFIAVGDVSDKGVPAAIFMARAMTLLQQYAQGGASASEIMATLNNDLVEGNENCMFVTLFIGWLTLDNGVLEFASGGHTAPNLVRGDSCIAIEQEQGAALGLMESLDYASNRITLAPGDLLVVYTDGIDEAFNPDGQQFGEDGLKAVLLEERQHALVRLGPAVFHAVDEHAGTTPQSDDITLMLLKIPTARRGSRLELTATPGALAQAQAWLEPLVSALPDETRNVLMLVAEEALTNIVKYAGLADSDLINLSFEEGDGVSWLELNDPGIAFNPLVDARRSTLGADTESAEIGGLGVHLLEALTDAQIYERRDDRNVLRLKKLY